MINRASVPMWDNAMKSAGPPNGLEKKDFSECLLGVIARRDCSEGLLSAHCRKGDHRSIFKAETRAMGAMLVKMAVFPEVKRVSGMWVGFSKNNITCALIFQTKFLGVILTKGFIFQSVMFFRFIIQNIMLFYLLRSKD